MKLSIGNPATGANYFHRPAVVKKLKRALGRGHVLFLGPRRTGKTSILCYLRDNPEDGTVVLHLNLEKYDTPAAWLEDMIGKLKALIENKPAPWVWVKKKAAAVKSFLKRIEEVKVPGGGVKLRPDAAADWLPVARTVLEFLAEVDSPLLILLDEFPWFLKHVAEKSGKENANVLLGWFRDARNTLAERHTRFLVTGSIGLHGIVRRLGLTKVVNDFDEVKIEPLEEAEALNFLAEVAGGEQIALTQLGRQRILELLGGNIPFLLQLFLAEIQEWQESDGEGGEPRTSDLQRIYTNKVAAGSRNKYCSEMWDRLPVVFTDAEIPLAKAVLRRLAQERGGHRRSALEEYFSQTGVPHPDDGMETVLETLEHDGYIVKGSEEDPGWRFSSNILRDWWRQKRES